MRPIYLFFLLGWLLAGCAKIEMTKVDSPAYFRVFNDLNYKTTFQNKDKVFSTLTMLIDPVMDAKGMPVSASVVGDFLVPRNIYAPPYPSYIGNSTDNFNPEYPGKERVIAGPILNGFDLSSWAQLQSGKKRFVFYSRPKTAAPFFSLDERFRQRPLLDTTLDLSEGQVYTIHILEKDFTTRAVNALVRKEIFQTLPLADSLVYVNFYNYSSKGFWSAPDEEKPLKTAAVGQIGGAVDYLGLGLRDSMNVFFTVFRYKDYYKDLQFNLRPPDVSNLFNRNFVYTIYRSTEDAAVSPYFSFPVFAGSGKDSIVSGAFEKFDFVHPSIVLQYKNDLYGWDSRIDRGTFFSTYCFKNGVLENFWQSYTLPNLIITIPSGKYAARSFGTVNTIEFVNGYAYLTTVQRVYAPPSY